MKNDGPNPPGKDGARPALTEGIDFYFEDGLMVLTVEYLRKRGYCCGNGCRHCPYQDIERPQSKNSSNSL